MSAMQNLEKPEDGKPKFESIKNGIVKMIKDNPDFIPDANTVLAT